MGFLSGMLESFGKGKLRKEQREQLYEIIGKALLDGHITDGELHEINNFYLNSNLTAKELNEIRDNTFLHFIARLTNLRKITIEEWKIFDHVGQKLMASPNACRTAYEKMLYHNLLHYDSSSILPSVNIGNVILRSDEEAYFDVNATLLEQRVVSRKVNSHYQSMSFRIMRGVSYRVGSSQSSIDTQMGLVAISYGKFVITSKRLIFSGDQKSVSHNTDKIIDIRLYSDAIQFSVSNRQKPITIAINSKISLEICGMLISNILNA